MSPSFGTREWFEEQFKNSTETGEDNWGHQWRASVRFKYFSLVKILVQAGCLKKSTPQQILDIGCGLGDLSYLLFQQNTTNQVVGIDISANAIAAACRKYPELSFQVDDLPDLKTISQPFHGILCVATIYYLKPGLRPLALQRIRDILIAEGWFLFSVPLDYMTENESIELIENAGLKIRVKFYHYSILSNKFERPFMKFRRFPALFKIIRWLKILEIYWLNTILQWVGQKLDLKSNIIILAEK